MDKNFVVHERSAFTPFAVKVAPKPFHFENAHFGAFSSVKSNGSMRIEDAQRCKDDFKHERSQKKNAFAFIKRMFQPTTCNDASSQPDRTISLK